MAHTMNMENVRRRRAELAREKDEREKGAHFDEIKEGANRRRILPPWSADGNWRKHAAYHYNIVDKKALVCPKKTFGSKCPICELVDELWKEKKPESTEQAKKWKAKDRFFANVLNLDLNDGKVYVMAFGPQLEESILDAMDGGSKDNQGGGDQFGVGDITHPKTGRSILVNKDVPPGHKEQTSYKAQAALNATEVANWPAVEKMLHNLDEVVQKDVYSYEDLMKFVMGEQPAAASTPAAETKPAASTAAVTSEFEKPVAPAGQDEFGRPVDKAATPAAETKTASTATAETKPATGGGSALDRLRAMKAAQTSK